MYRDMSNCKFDCADCKYNDLPWYELPCDGCCAAHCGFVKKEESDNEEDKVQGN